MKLDINKIIVHPGRYHADELVGVVLIKTLFPLLKKVPIIRSRPTKEELEDPSVLIIDCGEEYNPSLNNFDHHQDKTLFCSSRMLWGYFYPDNRPLIKKAVDLMFFRSIDRHDRGLSFATGNSISIAVSTMNENQIPFEKALDFVETAFTSILKSAEKLIPIREYWYSGKSFGGTHYLRVFSQYCSISIRDQFIEYARQRKRSLYLIWPISDDGKYIIYSVVPTYKIENDRRQIDNDGVAAVYSNKDMAINHALEMGVKLIQKRKKLNKRAGYNK